MDGDLGQFDMTAFSLRLTNGANAVSQLHAADRERDVARHQRPGHPRDHQRRPRPDAGSGRRSRDLLARYLDADLDDLDAGTRQGRFWERIERIPAKDLWDAHLRQKRELALFAQARLRSQFARHGEAPSVLAELETALDPSILTIGFARRFATYKRAGLLFTELDRLERMLRDPKRPIQVVFAGKAHPADRPGQKVIQEIFQLLAIAGPSRPGVHRRGLRHAAWRASWSRAPTSGSTTRGDRSRRPEPPA